MLHLHTTASRDTIDIRLDKLSKKQLYEMKHLSSPDRELPFSRKHHRRKSRRPTLTTLAQSVVRHLQEEGLILLEIVKDRLTTSGSGRIHNLLMYIIQGTHYLLNCNENHTWSHPTLSQQLP